MSNIVIPDGGNIGSTSDTDAISISSSGAVTLSSDFVPNTPLSHRNMIINGAMQVAQRGTQVTGVTGNGYQTCDRFKFLNNGLGTWTIDQSTDAPDGFSNSFKATCTAVNASPTAGAYLLIQQKIEAQNLQHLAYGTSSAKPITLSFWVKSNKAGNASVEFTQIDNSSESFSVRYTINSANTWEQKTVYIPADDDGIINNDNDAGLEVNFWLNSGANFTSGSHPSEWQTYTEADRNASNLGVGGATSDYFSVTGVQLELGSVATPFEHRSYADELRSCQRYCVVYGDGTNGCGSWVLNGGASSATSVYFNYLLPTVPRSTPSVSCSGIMRISDNYVSDHTANPPTIVTQPGTQDVHTNGGRVYLGSFSGLTTGRNYGSGRDSGTGKTTFLMEL